MLWGDIDRRSGTKWARHEEASHRQPYDIPARRDGGGDRHAGQGPASCFNFSLRCISPAVGTCQVNETVDTPTDGEEGTAANMPSAPLDHLLNPEPSSHSNSRQRQQPAPRYPPAVASRHINLLRSPLNLEGSSTSVLDSNNDTDTDDIFTFLEDIDDSEAEEEENLPTTATNMPAATRNSTRRHSVVDLTETPDTHSTSRRRKRSEDEGGPAPRKRGRVSKEDVEEIDLAEDENPSAEEELRQAQQQDAIRAQQAEMDAGAKKLGKMQCIICMESYTDATATACGMFGRIWRGKWESSLTCVQATSTAMSVCISRFLWARGEMSGRAHVRCVGRPSLGKRDTTSFPCLS